MQLTTFIICLAQLLVITTGQTRILTGGAGEDDPLKCATADGLVGDCRPWRYCRVVRQQYPKQKPTICLYRPKDPIVCCPRKEHGQFITAPTQRPTARPTSSWRPIAAPNTKKPSLSGSFIFSSSKPSSSKSDNGRRPGKFITSGTPSERLKDRRFIGHKDCGIASPRIRADFDQLELRRRRRRSPMMDRSHASAPQPDRSHASAPASPFDYFDSLEYPEEEQENYVAYTEPPPTEHPGSSVTAGNEPAEISSDSERTIRFTFLPPEPDAVDLVYGEGEGGYIRDFEIRPEDLGNETLVIRTGRKQDDPDPYGIYSPEYRDRVNGLLADARYVTGGTDALVGRWPWLALIGERRARTISWFCGGTILNEEYIITAAHCLGKFQKNRLVVRVGEFDLNYDTDSQHQDLLVDRIIMHPEYRHVRKHHDIALLHLSRRVRLGGHVRPICLSGRDDDITGQAGAVAGWGHTEFGGERSSILQEAELSIVDTKACEDKYRTLGKTFDADFAPGFGTSKLCAHDTRGGGRDACQGDSGGPLTLDDPESGRVRLAGIVSSGVGCGHPTFPGIYTRVTSYLDWILRHAFKNGADVA